MSRAQDLFNTFISKGELALDEFIAARQSEELFLDFKRSSDGGVGKKLHDNDRNNLSKAISGFGNSEGGIIIWGVDCSSKKDFADVAHTKYPIHDPQRFVSWLENAVSGCTIPPHPSVRHHAIVSSSVAEKGFVASLIPKSDAVPHMAISNKHYYIRAGSNFETTPHDVLAGMFGRRPQPNVFVMFAIGPAKISGQVIKMNVDFVLANKGPGIAKDMFLTVKTLEIPKSCEAAFVLPNSGEWHSQMSLGIFYSVICRSDIRLPPDASVTTASMNLSLKPPFEKRLHISLGAGASGCPTQRCTVNVEKEELDRLYDEYVSRNPSATISESVGRDLATGIWKTQDDE
jgi:Putative DNA-binding domain